MMIKKRMQIMNKHGIINKSQKEIYHVLVNGKEYLCKARGVFREKSIKPLVGDRVEVQILDDATGYIENVFERKNFLIRPPIANIDQLLLVSSLTNPKLNYNIFDKYLVMLEHFEIPVKLVINKVDLASREEIDEFVEIYSKTDYEYIFTSANQNHGIDDLRRLLKGKISSFAGPSGVGKSTLLNLLHDDFYAETGSISDKNKRGRHTTRHVELFEIDDETFIFDTPGFSALNLDFIESHEEVKEYFPEFNKYSTKCKFRNCMHINEPSCKVKEAVENSLISKNRYENYIYIVEDIKKERKF